MKIIWFDEAWEDYVYWQSQDKKTLKRVNILINDIKEYLINHRRVEPLYISSDIPIRKRFLSLSQAYHLDNMHILQVSAPIKSAFSYTRQL